jgi:nucleotide-binding universal stress UspA family protein
VVGDQPVSGHHVGVDGDDLILRAGDPGTQRPVVEGGLIRVDYAVRHADDDHAPAEMQGHVDCVSLIGDHGPRLGSQLRGDRGAMVRADDDVVAFARLLMGSVSSKVTHHPPCPVVVVDRT